MNIDSTRSTSPHPDPPRDHSRKEHSATVSANLPVQPAWGPWEGGRWFLLVLGVALAIRGTALLLWHPNLEQDPDHYGLIARNLANRGAFSRTPRPDQAAQPTAFRPPFYPLLLTLTVNGSQLQPVRIAWLHLVLGLTSVAAMFLVGLRATGSHRLAALAAAGVAIDPILLYQSTFVMTETLATGLAVLAWLLLARTDPPEPSEGIGTLRPRRWQTVAAGLVLGLAVLCRPTFLVWAATCVAVFACGRLPIIPSAPLASRRRRWHAPLFLLLGILMALTPWVARNWYVLGKPIVTTTHGGYTLLLGNNPQFYRHLRTAPAGTVWDSKKLDEDRQDRWRELGGDEVRADQDAWAAALQTIRRDPAGFFLSSTVRFGRLWRPLPHQLKADESPRRQMARYAVGTWYVVVYAAALGGLLQLIRSRSYRKAPVLWITAGLLVLTFSAMHTVFWSNLRMRAPLMPAVYLLAVLVLPSYLLVPRKVAPRKAESSRAES